MKVGFYGQSKVFSVAHRKRTSLRLIRHWHAVTLKFRYSQRPQ